MLGEIIGGIAGIGGAIADPVVNYYTEKENRKAAREAAKKKAEAIRQAGGAAETQYQAMMDELDKYNESRYNYSTPEQRAEYSRLVSEYDPQTYDFKQFEYGKTMDDFINPEAEKIAELAGLKKQAELAGQGAAGGTAGLAGMGYSRWEAANQLYNDAQRAMENDRSQAYREYGDYIDRMQKKLDTMNANQMSKINLIGGNISKDETAQSDYMADLLAVMGDKAANRINTAVAAYS